MIRTRMSALGYLLSALLSAGCGELTSGGVGEVEVYSTADDPAGAPQSSNVASPAPEGAPPEGSPASASAAEGLLAVEVRVYLQSDENGQWAEVTEGFRDLTLDLRGHTERRVGIKLLTSGRYTRFRAVFQRIEATVIGGLTVGGVPINGNVRVDLGGEGSVTVEREILVEVEADGSVDLVMDLNADAWLPTLSLTTRTVAAATFRDALRVRLR